MFDPLDVEEKPKIQTNLPLNTLHGIAGELIVEADLMMQGYWPWRGHYQGAQTSDLLVIDGGELVRIQVKAVAEGRVEDRTHKGQGVYHRGYQWSLRKGVGAKDQYNIEDIDVFALVALDIKQVAYVEARTLVRRTGLLTTVNMTRERMEEHKAFPGHVEAKTANAPDEG